MTRNNTENVHAIVREYFLKYNKMNPVYMKKETLKRCKGLYLDIG